MGSRTGDLDPGVLLHLLDDGLSVADLRSALEEHGGLRALSGGTADMRTLLQRRANGDERAALAVETYCRRIRMQIGAYAALLGGIDTLVFTGGIGEHAVEVRDRICAGLGYLGAVDVRVVAADEEVVIARATRAIVRSGS
jgi:acetate kinase